MNRILGIDYGDARTGLAITDELGITAQGLFTVESNGNDKMILKKIDELLQQYKIEKFVIGYPINMDGTRSERTDKTDAFIHKLKSRFNKIEIIQMDERLTTVEAHKTIERLTTVEAHKTMNYLNINNKNKKKIVDTIAAVYILESYINKQNK